MSLFEKGVFSQIRVEKDGLQLRAQHNIWYKCLGDSKNLIYMTIWGQIHLRRVKPKGKLSENVTSVLVSWKAVLSKLHFKNGVQISEQQKIKTFVVI